MSFRDLHQPGSPFLLPNAWDYASAAALVHAGFPAVGTTSLGVAAGAGLPDGEGSTRSETVALARLLRSLPGFLTVDIERGFSSAPGEVADLVASLDVDGVNIEDGTGPVSHQVQVISAVKSAAPNVFLNARTDTHWLRAGTTAEAVERCRAYIDAGADGVFVPGITDRAGISALTDLGAPLNTLLGAIPFAELAELGVSRVSTGSLLFRAALDTAVNTALSARTAVPPTPRFSYTDIQSVITLPSSAGRSR
jgi:2-methylisocitrate lyase-like PEP mutase family enzyme